MDLAGYRARGERAATYSEALAAVEQAALDEAAARDRALLQELLQAFAAAYAEAKARESALDFEDLQLAARDLLRDHEEIRERERLRFRSIMVDEFQDTNRLQTELVDLLRGPGTEIFFVGDEFQSIYGFRHADVGVFRERRAAAAQLLPLTRNYRSRPEVLAAINHLFGSHFGDEFQELAAAAEFPDPVFGRPVELLVTDKASYAETGVHWRRAEARAVARRVRELVDAGAASAGEIVLLFAAGTDAEWYEDELRKAGLPTYRATGKGYFGQQQVVDMLSYLRLLQNRYDDQALVAVLASPFVGLSNDGLALVRRAASKRPLFSGIERTAPAGLGRRDERLLRAFRQRFDRLVAAMPRLSLERLCERIVSEHDYDLAVLAQWDGRRRYANMRKLARLARSYEELRGPDVEGFVRFVAEQEAVGARELEAVAEEEGADAVRLLTIHAAKGLEFKVVIVADAGRDRAPPSPDEILALSDGRFGFRVADPVTTKRRGAFDYEAVKETRRAEDAAERLRLYYVAMTRAKERLIVSGSIDRGTERDATTPIGWVLARLGGDAELDAAGDAPLELERGDARLVVRVDRHRAEAWAEPEEQAAGDEPEPGQLALFSAPEEVAGPALAPELPPLVAPPKPPLHRVRRLSFTALSTFEQCSYKYFALRVAGMSERRAAAPPGGEGGLRATEIGDAVHRLLEQTDLGAPAVPDLEQVRTWYPAVSDEELRRIRGFVSSYCESAFAARVAALAPVEKERHFTFEHDGVLLHGYLDVLRLAGPHALVVDYKTNLIGESSPEEIVDADYRLQRLVYALACFRAGAEEVEVAYHFLERPDAVVRDVVRTRAPADARGGALRGDRQDPGRRVPRDAERFRLQRLPGARPRLRRPPPPGRRRPRRCAVPERRRLASPRGTELRRRGAQARRPEEAADRADRGAAGGGARRRGDRAPLPHPARAARLGDALGADDRRERQPGHAGAVRDVPAARGLPRRAAGAARARDLRDRVLPAEGEVAARNDADAAGRVRRRGAPHAAGARPAPRRRPQDGERGRRRARPRAGRRRRHACAPPLAAARPHEAGRPGEDRARPRPPRPARGLGALPAPADLARPPRLRRSPSPLRGLRPPRPLPGRACLSGPGASTAAAAEYERHRPEYPREALLWAAERLDLPPGRRVLDLGAGTGKLTRGLLALGLEAGRGRARPADAGPAARRAPRRRGSRGERGVDPAARGERRRRLRRPGVPLVRPHTGGSRAAPRAAAGRRPRAALELGRRPASAPGADRRDRRPQGQPTRARRSRSALLRAARRVGRRERRRVTTPASLVARFATTSMLLTADADRREEMLGRLGEAARSLGERFDLPQLTYVYAYRRVS